MLPWPELDDHWKLAVRWREAARGPKTPESSGLTGGADRDMVQPSCWTPAWHLATVASVTRMLQRRAGRLRLARRAVHPCDVLAGGPAPRSHMCEGMGRGDAQPDAASHTTQPPSQRSATLWAEPGPGTPSRFTSGGPGPCPLTSFTPDSLHLPCHPSFPPSCPCPPRGDSAAGP